VKTLLPIISLLELEKDRPQEIKKLHDVCYKYGSFYLKEYRISSDIINQTIEASRNFFKLSEDIKLNYRQDIAIPNRFVAVYLGLL